MRGKQYIRQIEAKYGKLEGRQQHTRDIKFIAWLILYDYGYTYQEIGEMFGYHHSTIINGVQKARYEIEHFAIMQDIYKELLNIFNGGDT